MIQAEGLTKRFGSVPAVEDVSFTAEPGELLAVLGHPGAGKSTLLRMLLGLVHPTSGTARVLGKPYAQLDRPLRRVGAALGDELHPWRTVREHLAIAAAQVEAEPGATRRVLGLVGLASEARVRARELGPSAQARLRLATALLAEPEVVVLDEPLAGLDGDGPAWLRELLRGLAGRGATVLVTGTDFDGFDEVADRVLVLDRGKLLAEEAPDRLPGAAPSVLLRSPGAEVVAAELRHDGVELQEADSEHLVAQDVPARAVGELAVGADVPVWELRERGPSLDAVLEDLDRPAVRDDDGDGPPDDDEQPPEPEDRQEEPLDDDERRRRESEEARVEQQLSRLREADRPRLVAVAAPSAGLGTTTVAFLAADALAATTGMSTLAIALSCDHDRLVLPADAEERSALHLGDLLDDLPDFDDLAEISPYVSMAPSGAHVLSGPEDPAVLEGLEPSGLAAVLDFAARFYRCVVLDLGPLPEPVLRAAVRRADHVLLLSAPDPPDPPERPEVLQAVEVERSEPAVIVVNLVERLPHDPPAGAVALPRDPGLVRLLDAGGFDLGAAGLGTRTAIKRLALAAAGGAR